MSNHAKTLNETAIISLLNDLETLAKAAKNVSERLLEVLPVKYGSSLWWKKETIESLKQYEKGGYRSFTSSEKLMEDLNS